MKHFLATAILAGTVAFLAPAAQAQTVTYEWPIADMQITTPPSPVCTIRVERAYAAGAGYPSYIYLQIRNTGSRALTGAGNVRFTYGNGTGARQGNFGGATLPPGTGTAVRTISPPPGGLTGSKLQINITGCNQ
jgi:hypothetical protein